MRSLLISFSFFFLFCTKKASVREKIQLQLANLNSYPDWPQKLCDKVVDTSLINSLGRSGLVAVKITNHDYNLVMIDLAEELLCDSLRMCTPNVQLIYINENGDNSLSTVNHSSHFGGTRIEIPKDRSKIILFDCQPNVQTFSKVEFLFSYSIDSLNVILNRELSVIKSENNEIEIKG